MLPKTDSTHKAVEYMKELPVLKTKNLVLCAAPADEVDIDTINEDNAIWYYPWYITIKNQSSTLIGIFRFNGPPVRGTVLLRVKEDRDYISSDIAEEALKAICDWAFAQKDVYKIRVHRIPDDRRYHELLEKCGFGPGPEPSRAEKRKTPTSWTLIYMLIGLSVGMTTGISLGSFVLGTILGGCGGIVLGILFDLSERKHRSQITGEKDDE